VPAAEEAWHRTLSLFGKSDHGHGYDR